MLGTFSLRRIAFGLGVLLLAPLLVVVGSETLSDPGGARGAALIGAWLVPLTLLVVLARRSPDAAARVLIVLTTVFVALSAWYAWAPDAWRDVEGNLGPVRAVALLALSAALVVHGLRSPELAGLLLLVTGAAPVALAAFDSGAPRSLMVASIPAMVLGTLYACASLIGLEPDAGDDGRADRSRQRTR